MGTNYYLHDHPCPLCGKQDEPAHIGKSSGGWVFSLHVSEKYPNLDAWWTAIMRPGAQIRDEYGSTIEPNQMMRTILCRFSDQTWDSTHRWGYKMSESSFHHENKSERGICGLLRPRGAFPPDSTFVHVEGDFS